MDSQLTTALAPKYRKDNRYDFKNIKTPAPVNNSDGYHKSKKQEKGRISTYDKIVQELSKEEKSSIGKPLISILGGGDVNVFNPSASPGRNTNVGGTITLYPSGGIHFHNFKPSFSVDLSQMPTQLSTETKGISNRVSLPSTKSPPELLEFVEKFNKQEDEVLCPDDFLDYRDSQAVELATESDGEMVNQDDLVNNKASNDKLQTSTDKNYHCIDNQSTHNVSFEDKQQLFPNKLAELVSPLPTISSPFEISNLKGEIESTAIYNAPEVSVLTFQEEYPNIASSSVANTQSSLDLISRVRSFSGSSVERAKESSNIVNREQNMLNSSESSNPNVVTWKSGDSICLSAPKNSSSNSILPPSRERKLSESLLGFVTGIFGNSPNQSISERSEHIKEVAEISMIFRY